VPKKAKVSHINTDIRELPNYLSVAELLENEANRFFPGKTEWRQRLCYTMLKWAEKPDSYYVSDFIHIKGMSWQGFHDWVDKYPDIAETYTAMKQQLGIRLAKGALLNKFNVGVAFRKMHRLDPEAIDDDAYHAALAAKKDGDKQASTFNIIMGDPKVQTAGDLKKEVDDINSK